MSRSPCIISTLPPGLPLQRCCPRPRFVRVWLPLRRRFMVYEQVMLETRQERTRCACCGMLMPTRYGLREVEEPVTAEALVDRPPDNKKAPWLEGAAL